MCSTGDQASGGSVSVAAATNRDAGKSASSRSASRTLSASESSWLPIPCRLQPRSHDRSQRLHPPYSSQFLCCCHIAHRCHCRSRPGCCCCRHQRPSPRAHPRWLHPPKYRCPRPWMEVHPLWLPQQERQSPSPLPEQPQTRNALLRVEFLSGHRVAEEPRSAPANLVYLFDRPAHRKFLPEQAPRAWPEAAEA